MMAPQPLPPSLRNRAFLTDGGLETTLIFHEGVDLPHFATFVLLETPDGRAHLERYFARFLALAAQRGVAFMADTPTWRANPDWGAKLGYDAAALARINREGVAFMREIVARHASPRTHVAISGVVGPRGDGYKAGRRGMTEARDYHAPQIGALAAAGADIVSAMTIATLDEAIGIVLAAREIGTPCAISFTLETDGRLADGTTLAEAIRITDDSTGGGPCYYMINCAHPTHFDHALAGERGWRERIMGVRSNASTKSHAELDESETLDIGDPADLGERTRALRAHLPRLSIFGGCCGTDIRHVQAMCEACVPMAA